MSRSYENKLHYDGKFNLMQSDGKMRVYKDDDINSLTFNRDNYDSREEMWGEVATLCSILLKNNEVVKLRQEEQLVIVEHIHDESIEYYGGTQLMYLTADEAELIESYRAEDSRTIAELLAPKPLRGDDCDDYDVDGNYDNYGDEDNE